MRQTVIEALLNERHATLVPFDVVTDKPSNGVLAARVATGRQGGKIRLSICIIEGCEQRHYSIGLTERQARVLWLSIPRSRRMR